MCSKEIKLNEEPLIMSSHSHNRKILPVRARGYDQRRFVRISFFTDVACTVFYKQNFIWQTSNDASLETFIICISHSKLSCIQNYTRFLFQVAVSFVFKVYKELTGMKEKCITFGHNTNNFNLNSMCVFLIKPR